MRRWILVSIVSLAVLVPTAFAQPRRARDMRWHTFVAGEGMQSVRAPVTDEPGRIDLGSSSWSCGYARTRFAGVGTAEWSLQRVLACRRGDATVSTTAWCRVHRGRFEEHAAVLSLGATGNSEHITVTLSCDPR